MPLIAAAITLATAGTIYALVLAAQPFAPCRHCRQPDTPNARGTGCPHCDHTGVRIRRGRHLYNLLRDIRHDTK